ncbi:MAG: hypothetical protein ACREPY_18355 [Rhodanobacteraceae bacterium]
MSSAALESAYAAVQAANSTLHSRVDTLQAQLAEVTTQLPFLSFRVDDNKPRL